MLTPVKSAVLVITYRGEARTGYGGRSACPDVIVVSFLAKGILPGSTQTCSS